MDFSIYREKMQSFFQTAQQHHFYSKGINYILPLLLVLYSFMTKFQAIHYQSLSGDEPFTVYHSQFSIVTIIRELSQGNNPPLFEIILHIWGSIMGISEKSVRLLPSLFSSVTVFYIYKILQKHLNVRVALIASFLFIFSNYQMYFAHEARVYSLFMMLASISMYAFITLLHDPQKKYFPLIYIAANVLMIYGHFLAFFIIFAQLVCVVGLKSVRTVLFKKALIYNGIVLLFYLPYLPIFLKRFFVSSAEGTWISPVQNLGPLHEVLLLLTNNSVTNYMLFIILVWLMIQLYFGKIYSSKIIRSVFSLLSIFFLFYGISIVTSMPKYWEFSGKLQAMSFYVLFIVTLLIIALKKSFLPSFHKVVIVWFFVPLLIMFISSIWVPMFIERYWIFVTPAFFILIAIGLYNIDKNFSMPVSLVAILIMWITFNKDVDKKRDVKKLVETAVSLQQDKTAIFICPDYFDLTFTYYYNRDMFEDVDNEKLKTHLVDNLKKDNVFPVRNASEIDTASLKQYDKILFIDASADFCYPNNNINTILTNLFTRLNDSISVNKHEIPQTLNIYEYNIESQN